MDLCVAEVVRVAHLLYGHGLGLTGGNVSVRGGNTIYITPSGLAVNHHGQLAPGEVCAVQPSGGSKTGMAPSRDTAVHSLFYDLYPNYQGVVHAHPPFLLGLSVSPEEWNPITDGARSIGPLLVCRHDPRSGVRLVDALEACLREAGKPETLYGTAVFVPGHGVYAASWTARRALYLINKMEENARTMFFARILSV